MYPTLYMRREKNKGLQRIKKKNLILFCRFFINNISIIYNNYITNIRCNTYLLIHNESKRPINYIMSNNIQFN